MDRLGELDDLPIRETLHDGFAEILVGNPDVAEIAAAVNENRTGRHALFQLICRKVRRSRNIVRAFAEAILQIGHFTQPDCGVAAIADVGKIEDRKRFIA